MKKKRKESKVTVIYKQVWRVAPSSEVAIRPHLLPSLTLFFPMVCDSTTNKEKTNKQKTRERQTSKLLKKNIPFDQSIFIVFSVYCCIFFIRQFFYLLISQGNYLFEVFVFSTQYKRHLTTTQFPKPVQSKLFNVRPSRYSEKVVNL